MAAISPVTIEAKYYHRDGGDIVCDLCPRYCRMKDGQTGFCGARRVENGILVANTYGRISCIMMDPMEKKPFYNYHPGERVFSVGGIGCNLSCRHCQNYALSQSFSGKKRTTYKSPEEIVSMCRWEGSDFLAFTYNEPGIWYEYMMDVAAHAPDIRFLIVSNGMLNKAPLEDLCGIADAFNIDIKGFDEDFYENICGGHLKDVLDSVTAIFRSGKHLEITYLVIPEYNDGEEGIRAMSEWIAANLSVDVPLHFTRFHPDNEMTDVPWTPEETLIRARRIAMDAGLRYVYIGNMMSEEGSDTFCPDCGRSVIERTGYHVDTSGLDGDRCRMCGRRIALIR